MMLLILLGCPDPADKADDTGVADTDTDTDTDVDPEDWTPSDPASNLCVTIAGPAEAGTSGIGAIATVLEGETACVGGDTGGHGFGLHRGKKGAEIAATGCRCGRGCEEQG